MNMLDLRIFISLCAQLTTT